MLYHATYKPLLSSILKHGLDNRGRPKNWEDSLDGVAYLAETPEEAESFVECSESDHIPDEWFQQIVILEIDLEQLDLKYLRPDQNNDGLTWEYHGVIPPSAIKILESR